MDSCRIWQNLTTLYDEISNQYFFTAEVKIWSFNNYSVKVAEIEEVLRYTK